VYLGRTVVSLLKCLLEISWKFVLLDFTARRYASAEYAVSSSVCVCLCVCLTVCQRRYCIKTAKRIGSRKQRHVITQGLFFWRQRFQRNSNRVIPRGGGANCKWGRLKSATFGT